MRCEVGGPAIESGMHRQARYGASRGILQNTACRDVTEAAGQWCWLMGKWSGSPTSFAARPHRPDPEGRTSSGIAVSASSVDPRLDGRAVRRIAYDAATIQQRVQELGAQITAAYPDGELLVLGLLKGSFIFLSDLVRHIERPLQVDFLVASSYGDAMESSGVVRLLYDPETELEGKHILLVEDIVDSGRTLARLLELLEARNPKSLAICALLHKHIAEHLTEPVQFVGFDAPHEFLVGYGLDHAEHFRHLPYVASLE